MGDSPRLSPCPLCRAPAREASTVDYLLGARSAWTPALLWAGRLASGSCCPSTAGSSRLKPVHLLAEQSECPRPSQPCLGTDNSPVSMGPFEACPGLGRSEAGCWLLAATLFYTLGGANHLEKGLLQFPGVCPGAGTGRGLGRKVDE